MELEIFNLLHQDQNDEHHFRYLLCEVSLYVQQLIVRNQLSQLSNPIDGLDPLNHPDLIVITHSPQVLPAIKKMLSCVSLVNGWPQAINDGRLFHGCDAG